MFNSKNFQISIITASYNYAEYIKETIESVINQTYKNWEMIIIDDGSTDNSVQVIKHFCQKDSRIKLFTHLGGINKGLTDTIKKGIEVASGEWIIFLESDDTITPNYIEEKVKVIQKYPYIKFIFNDVNLFGDEEGIEIFKNYLNRSRKALQNLTFPANIANLFIKYNPVPTFSAVMVKKASLENLNFNSFIPQWVDYYLWSQLAANNDFYYINKKLTNFRIHKYSYNTNKINLYKTLYFVRIVIADNLEINNKLKDKLLFFREIIILTRKKIIKFHPKENEIILFGRKYRIV